MIKLSVKNLLERPLDYINWVDNKKIADRHIKVIRAVEKLLNKKFVMMGFYYVEVTKEEFNANKDNPDYAIYGYESSPGDDPEGIPLCGKKYDGPEFVYLNDLLKFLKQIQ